MKKYLKDGHFSEGDRVQWNTKDGEKETGTVIGQRVHRRKHTLAPSVWKYSYHDVCDITPDNAPPNRYKIISIDLLERV